MSNRVKKSLQYAIYTYIGLFLLGCVMILIGLADSSQTVLTVATYTLWPAVAVFIASYLYIVKK
jgi:hypothetical protein